MQIKILILLLSILSSIFGCTADNVLTKQEIENQNNSSEIVTGILFDNDLDYGVSYIIRKDGYVVIQFDSSVPETKYTKVVNQLRSSNIITGVLAEQSGVEVCPLP